MTLSFLLFPMRCNCTRYMSFHVYSIFGWIGKRHLSIHSQYTYFSYDSNHLTCFHLIRLLVIPVNVHVLILAIYYINLQLTFAF